LATIAKITDSEAHGIIQAGIMGVAGLSQAIMEMEAYSAISGFTDHDLPLFRHKLNQFYELASSEKREHTFDRVINIADIADFSPSQELINISQLLKVRDSIELKEFRRWLPEIGRSTDQEIASAVSSVRAKLGLKVGGTKGKIIRALVTSGVLVRSLVGSIVLNLCDAFLVERLLPRTGIAAFVNELYPSLFKSKAEPMSGEDFSLASAKEKAPLEH